MNKDLTYCSNSKCKEKYKCNMYFESSKKINGQEFWSSEYNPNDCPKAKKKEMD